MDLRGGGHPIHIFFNRKRQEKVKRGIGGLAKSIFFQVKKMWSFYTFRQFLTFDGSPNISTLQWIYWNEPIQANVRPRNVASNKVNVDVLQ